MCPVALFILCNVSLRSMSVRYNQLALLSAVGHRTSATASELHATFSALDCLSTVRNTRGWIICADLKNSARPSRARRRLHWLHTALLDTRLAMGYHKTFTFAYNYLINDSMIPRSVAWDGRHVLFAPAFCQPHFPRAPRHARRGTRMTRSRDMHNAIDGYRWHGLTYWYLTHACTLTRRFESYKYYRIKKTALSSTTNFTNARCPNVALLYRILERITFGNEVGPTIVLQWFPRHCDIQGNVDVRLPCITWPQLL